MCTQDQLSTGNGGERVCSALFVGVQGAYTAHDIDVMAAIFIDRNQCFLWASISHFLAMQFCKSGASTLSMRF
jgi:hypothetical protein